MERSRSALYVIEWKAGERWYPRLSDSLAITLTEARRLLAVHREADRTLYRPGTGQRLRVARYIREED